MSWNIDPKTGAAVSHLVLVDAIDSKAHYVVESHVKKLSIGVASCASLSRLLPFPFFFNGSVLVLFLLPFHLVSQLLTLKVTRVQPETVARVSLLLSPNLNLMLTSILSHPCILIWRSVFLSLLARVLPYKI